MSSVEKLSQKEKSLIAAAASITSGCLPCTVHHLKSVRETGATEAEVLEAIDIALGVRKNATNIIAEAAQGNPNREYLMEEYVGPLKQPVIELVSIGAALACNYGDGLEGYLTRARAAGATTLQIKIAARIARAIRKEAEEKAEALFEYAIKPTGVKTDEQPEGCCQQGDNRQRKQSDENGSTNAEKEKESNQPSCGCS